MLLAVDRVTRQLEFQARLIGQIDERPTITLVQSTEWTVVRSALLVALAPFPDARLAVVNALTGLQVVS